MNFKLSTCLLLIFCALELGGCMENRPLEELRDRLKAIFSKVYDNSIFKKYLDGIKKETQHARHHDLEPSKCAEPQIDVKWPTGRSLTEISAALQDAAKGVEKALHDHLRCLEFLIYKVNFDDPHMPDPDAFKLSLS